MRMPSSPDAARWAVSTLPRWPAPVSAASPSIDRDYVEPSNLHRQWLFEEADAAESLPKAAAAARRIARINSSMRVRGVVADLTAANVAELLGDADIILDGTDNFETRYLINDFAVSRGIPWIYGAAVAAYGLTMPVVPGRTACLRCVYPDPPAGAQPTCETAGVLNVIVSAVASIQVADALRSSPAPTCVRASPPWIFGTAASARSMRPPAIPIAPPAPAANFPTSAKRAGPPISLCGRNAVQISRPVRAPSTSRPCKLRLAPLGRVRANEFALRFFTAPYELTVFPDGRAIVKGTSDTGLARSLYARYIG